MVGYTGSVGESLERSEYEEIDILIKNMLTIKIMNGVEVVLLECELNQDGALLEGVE